MGYDRAYYKRIIENARQQLNYLPEFKHKPEYKQVNKALDDLETALSESDDLKSERDVGPKLISLQEEQDSLSNVVNREIEKKDAPYKRIRKVIDKTSEELVNLRENFGENKEYQETAAALQRLTDELVVYNSLPKSEKESHAKLLEQKQAELTNSISSLHKLKNEAEQLKMDFAKQNTYKPTYILIKGKKSELKEQWAKELSKLKVELQKTLKDTDISVDARQTVIKKFVNKVNEIDELSQASKSNKVKGRFAVFLEPFKRIAAKMQKLNDHIEQQKKSVEETKEEKKLRF